MVLEADNISGLGIPFLCKLRCTGCGSETNPVGSDMLWLIRLG